VIRFITCRRVGGALIMWLRVFFGFVDHKLTLQSGNMVKHSSGNVRNDKLPNQPLQNTQSDIAIQAKYVGLQGLRDVNVSL
jgi:hypothetical protein